MAEIEKIPVTILTGFLGSGKTTLLNWILQHQHGKKIAVIENEFGEVGVDDALVRSKLGTEELIMEMNNGCICCTVRGDLIEAFKKLMAKKVKLDCIIIETTGLADPAPVCQTFFVDPNVEKHFRLDAVVTIVDAKHILEHLDEVKPEGVENESIEQVAFADKIILNKLDLVDSASASKVEDRLKQINRYAKVIRAQLNTECIPLDEILGLDAFSIKRVLELDPLFLEDQDHQHDQTIGSVGIRIPGDLNVIKLQSWLGRFIQQYGKLLYRYKGLVAVRGKKEKFVFQGVHMLLSGVWSEEWKEGEVRESRFCFIGKNLPREEIEKQFNDCRVTEELRFKVGDKVKCNMEEGYIDGTVTKLWDEGNAYAVKLVTGMFVWAPEDVDEYIKK